MITLLQLINRMIYLEYTKDEVRDMLDTVKNGHMPAETLFVILNCEIPKESVLNRFKQSLAKAESATAISFLRYEEEP